MSKRFFSILTIFLLIGCSIPILPTKASNETILTTLSTFYNESVSGSYELSGNTNVVVPLEVTTQGNVAIKVDYPSLSVDYIMKVYTDDSYINLIQSSLLSATQNTHTITITAGSSETLYLYFSPTAKDINGANYQFTITATLKAAAAQNISTNKTLQNKSWTKKKIVKAKSKHYYKLVVKGNRYFYLSSNNSYINVQLLDKKKKKALSSVIPLKSSNNFQASFSLGKGTYYVAVTADYQTTYQLYYQSSTVKNVSGKGFKTAPKMTMGQQYLGLLKATTSTDTGQYYKFRLTKAKKLQIAFYVENSSSQFQLQLYDAQKNPLPTNNYRIGNASLLYINSRAATPAGTYYIRVSKVNRTSSGCYSLLVRTR